MNPLTLSDLPYMAWADANPFLFYVFFMCGMGLIVCLVTAIAERIARR